MQGCFAAARDGLGRLEFIIILLAYQSNELADFKLSCLLAGVAKARAKKDAKQMAAKALLLSMDENVSTILAPTKGEAEHESPQPTLDCDPEVEGNPVGELNDICVKIKKPPPEYEVRVYLVLALILCFED